MLGRDYADQTCSIARSLEVVGERWSLLIVRDVLTGKNRFDELVESLGVTRTVLSQRLRHLIDEGVLERVAYSDRPKRYAYQLTEKGQALTPVIAHLLWWGDTYYPEPAGPPRLLLHAGCGGGVNSHFDCRACGAALGPGDITTELGPGAAAPRVGR